MNFDFGNNNKPNNPEEENNSPFSFNLDNTDADTNDSVAENASPFDLSSDNMTDESDENAIANDEFFNGEKVDEETPQFVPDISEKSLEEVKAEVEDDIFNNDSEENVAEESAQDNAFVADAEQPSEDIPQEDEQTNEFDETEDSDVAEAEIEESSSEDDAQSADEFEVTEEDAVLEEDVPPEPEEETTPALSALDKKVRTPDGEQEYLLSELIDVETGEPLDLTSLIPEELLTATVTETTGGFSLGAAQPTTGGFDMSAGSESSAPSKRKRPARPKAQKKGGGSIVGIVFGGLLAFILFPYVMALIEMTTGAQSNIPIPAPGIKSTYKYIPEWWPDWAMFVFPGRTTETGDVVNEQPQSTENKSAPANNDVPAPADDEAPAADDAPADDAPADDAPADDAAAAEDGSFDPDAFLGNDGAENAAEPEDVPADEPAEPAKPAEPGVVNAPKYTSADVSETVANVGAAFKEAKEIDDTVYAALNEMAEKSTFVDTSAIDEQLKDAMGKVRTAMGKFGTKPDFASSLSEKWAARVEDESDDAGVLFVGNLTSVAERDGYQINTINVEGQDGSVEVVGLRKIKPAVGDKVVVCGKRIANPDKNLGGFTDNGLPVVWGGIVIKAEEK